MAKRMTRERALSVVDAMIAGHLLKLELDRKQQRGYARSKNAELRTYAANQTEVIALREESVAALTMAADALRKAVAE